MEELTKICPANEAHRDYQPEIKALVLPWINNNAGLVVMCKRGWILGECPMERKYICQFPLNPEKRYPSGDPRNMRALKTATSVEALSQDLHKMKVLHDWDGLWISGRWALERSISLFCYLLSKKFPILRKVKYFHEKTEKIKTEQLAYMEILIKLNKLSGVSPIFGIRDVIREKYGEEIDELALKYGVDIRRHIHIGELSDPNRTRLWEPPLTQSKETWHFDAKWAKGEKVILKPNECAVFHVDYPHYLSLYIDYLFEVCIDGSVPT